MNINNFKTQINKTILDRGYDYFIVGNVVEICKQRDNEYIFQVQGNNDYEVVIKIDDQGEILYSECDCPYDFGSICKHEVAAYFELIDIVNGKNNNLSVKKVVTKQPEIKEVLSNLSKEDLIKIIIDMTQKDSTLENSLIIRYSKVDNDQELKLCKKHIEAIVSKYAGREDFIPYGDTYDYVDEMEDLLERSRNTDDILLAFDIAFMVLNEAIEAFQYADDSNGAIGYLASETIELIKEIITDCADLDISIREMIFNKVLAQSDNKAFNRWEDYKIDLLRLCIEFADIEALREQFKKKIEYIISKNSSNEYKEYYNEQMLQILFQIIDTYGCEEDAVAFIKENTKYTSFRELLISKYIKEKNYSRVVELTMEGEKQDKQYTGLVSKWKKIRYNAYKKLSLKEEQERLSKELLFDGNFEYYKELKELVTGDKRAFYDNLKQELKDNNHWPISKIYLELIVHENDLDEIIEYVRKYPWNIEEYANMLKEKFKDEVIDLYIKHIKKKADNSSNRKEYQRVCQILKRYKKIAGVKKQEELINELATMYRRRPAFIDELSKT